MKLGMVMPLSAEAERAPRPYAELREMARTAESAGLDSIWVFDHLLYRFAAEPQSGTHESWTILSALAADTSRIGLGTLVLAMGFRNPALLAKMAATLQEVSGGRLTLGVGAGWHQPEFDAFGIPFDHRVSRFEEALAILVPLLRRGSVTFEGRYQTARDAALLPPAPTPTRLLMAARRPRMMRLVARHADAFNCAWLGPVSGLEERVAPLRDACAQTGRDFADIEITVGVNVAFPALAADEEAPRVAIAGSAAEVAKGLREYADAGVGHVIASLTPASPDAVHELARAVELSRA